MATQTQTQVQDDDRLAQQMQQAEFAQAQGQPPVVAGVVVSGLGGYPPGQAPTSYGSPAGVGGVTIAAVPYTLPELLVFSYRRSLKFFAVIDIISTIFSTSTWIMNAVASQGREDFESTSLLGYRGLLDAAGSWGFLVLALLGLVFLVGPICGFVGATKLNRSLVAVYLAFCCAKAASHIAAAALRAHLWLFIIVLIQVWITRIVFKFWSALGMISPERLEQLRNPEALVGVPARIVLW